MGCCPICETDVEKCICDEPRFKIQNNDDVCNYSLAILYGVVPVGYDFKLEYGD
jgi:hypothetical protein